MDWEIVNNLCALFITVFMGWFAWESTKMVDEQKRRRRNPDLGKGKFDKQRVEYRDGDNT